MPGVPGALGTAGAARARIVLMESSRRNKINCFQCVHFAITWETKFPRCCRLFGFKTAKMPSVSVLESSGEPCAGFERKAPARQDKRRGWEA